MGVQCSAEGGEGLLDQGTLLLAKCQGYILPSALSTPFHHRSPGRFCTVMPACEGSGFALGRDQRRLTPRSPHTKQAGVIMPPAFGATAPHPQQNGTYMTHCSPAVTEISVPAYSEAIGNAHPVPTALLEDQTKPPRDRPFNPWRTPRREAARAIIAEAVRLLLAHEEAMNVRSRKRRQSDQETFEATVSAILCDLIHHHLIGLAGGVFITRSNRVSISDLATRSRMSWRP